MTAKLFVVMMKLEFPVAIVSQLNNKKFHLYSTMTDITNGKKILNALLYRCKSDNKIAMSGSGKHVTENYCSSETS